ncbi:hypothetical protein STXM2123_3156 [Streptomyces sp. F-3]|nr:hypothetical protein STXM2123_3156 [Streptomyces sp. F-3]
MHDFGLYPAPSAHSTNPRSRAVSPGNAQGRPKVKTVKGCSVQEMTGQRAGRRRKGRRRRPLQL